MEDSRFKAVYEQHGQHTVNCGVEVAVKQKDMMLELDADVVGGGRCKKSGANRWTTSYAKGNTSYILLTGGGRGECS